MHTLTMPISDAILASKALLHHVSTDDIIPVVCHAAIVEHDGSQYLIATDRYSFGRFKLGTSDTFEGEVGQMIPSAALDWVAKINLKGLRRPYAIGMTDSGYTVRYTWTPTDAPKGTELEVAIVFEGKPERAQTYDVYSGNFPPVVKLWRDGTVPGDPLSEVILSHSSLAKVTADVLLFGGKGEGTVGLQFSADKNGKPSPVQYTLGAGDRWTAALQPNMKLR